MTTALTPAALAAAYLKKAEEVALQYPKLDLHDYKEEVMEYATLRANAPVEEIAEMVILKALERISMQEPDWTFVASALHAQRLYAQAAANRGYDPSKAYGSYYELLHLLGKEGVYSSAILDNYTKAEIEEAEGIIVPERDELFTYIGLHTLASRYTATDKKLNVMELPQERWLTIAMTLMQNEPVHMRMAYVKEAYWALSNLYMTVATPTLANSGKAYGQLSSCFIDTVEDSLDGIYNSNTDVARLSKAGGGIGVYMGKIRSLGSDIKGFKGNSSGIVPWIKQLNNTASSVDQLGQRQGAMAVYYNVWGKDIKAFLDLRLNNGDERLRAHDIFTGVCLPDIFMQAVEDREDFYLFDPHAIKKVMGYELDDYFDAVRLQPGQVPNIDDHAFSYRYLECVEAALTGQFDADSWDTAPAIDLMKRIMRSQLETGVPFMFYRDTVNRANPNNHEGIVYCSNLCTEIFQNMSATYIVEEYLDADDYIVTRKKPGAFVVCNLSSINLGRAVPANVLARLIPVQVRMLDNVIELNTIEVLQAQHTNRQYRAIGLGTFGWQHLLALKGIAWEKEAAVELADELYNEIAYLTVKASADIAIEKQAYPLFKGSDWHTGAYFDKRDYTDERWTALRQQIAQSGIRNGYLMAVAPNSSTSIIAGSTASIDPIFKKSYSEEKKDYKIPVTAPDLNAKTTWYYKSAFQVDQHASIKQNAARQRHVDQGQSFNLYVLPTIQASELLALHMDAWESKLKTTYYVRSLGEEGLPDHVAECESCSS